MIVKDVKVGNVLKTWWGKMTVEKIEIETLKNGRKLYHFWGVNLGGRGTIVGDTCVESKYENSKAYTF